MALNLNITNFFGGIYEKHHHINNPDSTNISHLNNQQGLAKVIMGSNLI
jgi:hypothetical protein